MEAMPVVVALILAASILMGCTDLAVASDHEAGNIHIGGRVLCQDCTQGWNQWALGGKPIKGTQYIHLGYIIYDYVLITCILDLQVARCRPYAWMRGRE